jgi:predicted amidophosphoribosyltransferase
MILNSKAEKYWNDLGCKRMEDGTKYQEKAGDYDNFIMKNICPNCKNTLTHTRGCAICKKCGYAICEDLAPRPRSIK